MKYKKCIKLRPETVCAALREEYSPITVSGCEMNLNELAASMIEMLLNRVNELEAVIAADYLTDIPLPEQHLHRRRRPYEYGKRRSSPKARLIDSYLIRP